MIPGQFMRLVPFRNSQIGFKCNADRQTYFEVFTEEVRYIKMSKTGNAIIKDGRGNKRLCNPDDLAPIQ